MTFKTEGNFVRFAVSLWALFVLFDIAVVGAVAYVVYHFVCKFW